jgi:hypothetical protein
MLAFVLNILASNHIELPNYLISLTRIVHRRTLPAITTNPRLTTFFLFQVA